MARAKKPCGKKKQPRAADALDVIRKAQIANILKKQKAGKVLSSREEYTLREHFAQKPPAAANASESSERVWLTVSELLKWLEAQGSAISRKNLYRTYLDKGQIERNPEGRIHKWKALETIKVVQERVDFEQGDILRRRQEAAARVAEARADREEMEVARKRGELIELAQVRKVWVGAIEGIKSEQKLIELTLPVELAGATEEIIKLRLQTAHQEMWRHLQVHYAEAQKEMTNGKE